MPTARQFAEIAEGLRGVRWRKHGRDPAKGLDCGGLLVWPLLQLGLAVADTRDYDAGMPDSALLWRLCREAATEQLWQDQGEGRIGLCAWESGGVVRHLVLMLARNRIVHVDADARHVTVVPASWMESKLAAVFRVRGIEYGDPW